MHYHKVPDMESNEREEKEEGNKEKGKDSEEEQEEKRKYPKRKVEYLKSHLDPSFRRSEQVRSEINLTWKKFGMEMHRHNDLNKLKIRLVFCKHHVIDELIITISHNSHIRQLYLEFENVVSESAVIFKEGIGQLLNRMSFDTYFSKKVGYNSKYLSHSPYIKNMNIQGVNLENENLKAVQSLITKNTALKSITIRLYYTSIDNLRNIMEKLLSVNHISKLSINGPISLVDLFGTNICLNPHIQSLYLKRTLLPLEFTSLTDHTNLRAIRLDSNDLKDKEMAHLIRSLGKITSLCRLEILKNSFQEESCNALAEVIESHLSLSKLVLLDNDITEKMFQPLCLPLALNTKLDTLEVCGNTFCDVGSDSFGYIIRNNTSLRHLNLKKNILQPQSISYIAAALIGNTTLKSLSLKENNLTGKCMFSLFQSLKGNRTLSSLNICQCDLDDAGFELLSEYICHSRTVKTLKISHNKAEPYHQGLLTDSLHLNTSITSLGISEIIDSKYKNQTIQTALYRNRSEYDRKKLFKHRVRMLIAMQILYFGKLTNNDMIKRIMRLSEAYTVMIPDKDIQRIFEYATDRTNLDKKNRDDFQGIFTKDVEEIANKKQAVSKKRSFKDVQDDSF